MSKLLPLPHPEDWRIDENGRALVHRVKLKEGSSIYTLYEIRQVTWATTVKGCLSALARWFTKEDQKAA